MTIQEVDIVPVTSSVLLPAYAAPSYLMRLVLPPSNLSTFHISILIAAGPPYSIIIRSPFWIVCGLVRVNVYSVNAVPTLVESIVSLNVSHH